MLIKKDTYGDVKSFTISRKKWARGIARKKPNLLLNKDGTQCCLGVYASACGIPNSRLLNHGNPDDVALNYDEESQDEIRVWNTRLVDFDFYADKHTTELLIKANDIPELSEEEREDRVIRLFKRFGITVKFTK